MPEDMAIKILSSAYLRSEIKKNQVLDSEMNSDLIAELETFPRPAQMAIILSLELGEAIALGDTRTDLGRLTRSLECELASVHNIPVWGKWDKFAEYNQGDCRETGKSTCKIKYGPTLRVAARYGHQDLVEYLISSDDSNKNYNIGSAIIAASKGGYIEIVRYLLDHWTKDEKVLNNTLNNAALGGNLEIINRRHDNKLLIDSGATDLNRAMVSAAGKGKTEIIAHLRTKHATADSKAMGAAVDGNRTETLLYLLDINEGMVDNSFRYAARKGRTDIIRALLPKILAHHSRDRILEEALAISRREYQDQNVKLLESTLAGLN